MSISTCLACRCHLGGILSPSYSLAHHARSDRDALYDRAGTFICARWPVTACKSGSRVLLLLLALPSLLQIGIVEQLGHIPMNYHQHLRQTVHSYWRTWMIGSESDLGRCS